MVYKSKYPDLDIPQCNLLSYLFPRDKPLLTVPLWINADRCEDSLSPAAMLLWVQRFALGLHRLDVPENEAIMVFTPNHLFVPVVYLGAAGSKRYYTGANPAYTVDELAYQMTTVRAAVVLIHPSLAATGLLAAKKAGIPTAKTFFFSDSDCLSKDGVRDWKTLLASEKDARSWEWDDLGHEATQQIATINFSSGTTGLPKGVCTTHYNLVANTAQTIVAKFSAGPDTLSTSDPERWLVFLPLYHAFSQLFTINIACRMSRQVYIMNKFTLPKMLEYIQQYQVTAIQAVPPIMSMLAKRPETSQYNTSSLKNIMVGAAPLSVQIQNELMKRLDVYISRGWGMTETTCVGTIIPDNVINTDGSVGYLLPNTEAKILDEDGREIADGPGEMYVRGPQMMLGYWENDKATRETISADGWLKTGDTIVVSDHLWWIVDRKKELIKVNGFQVAPAELEALLIQHEGIADAAVVGVMAEGNEYPRAYVVLNADGRAKHLTEMDIQMYIASKTARHKHLTGGVQFKQAIPRLLSGKIMRSAVKEWAKKDAKVFESRL